MMYESFDAVPDSRDVPVDEKSESAIGNSQIGEKLSPVNGSHRLQGFVFYEDLALDDHIHSVPSINSQVGVGYRKWDLTLNRKSALPQFVSEARLVDRFQEPGAEGGVHCECSVNHHGSQSLQFLPIHHAMARTLGLLLSH